MSEHPSYEQVLRLLKPQLRVACPNGVIEVDEDQWRPAREGEKPDVSLRKLIIDRGKREEGVRFLRRSYSVPKLAVNGKSQSTANDNYTTSPGRALRVTGPDGTPEIEEGVSEEWLEKFAAEAHAANPEPRESRAKRLANDLAKLEREGAKLGLSFEQRTEQMLAAMREDIRQARRAA